MCDEDTIWVKGVAEVEPEYTDVRESLQTLINIHLPDGRGTVSLHIRISAGQIDVGYPRKHYPNLDPDDPLVRKEALEEVERKAKDIRASRK